MWQQSQLRLPGAVRLLQLPAQDLTRRVSWKLVHEDNTTFEPLVFRKLSLNVLDDLFLGWAVTLSHDERSWVLVAVAPETKLANVDEGAGVLTSCVQRLRRPAHHHVREELLLSLLEPVGKVLAQVQRRSSVELTTCNPLTLMRS